MLSLSKVVLLPQNMTIYFAAAAAQLHSRPWMVEELTPIVLPDSVQKKEEAERKEGTLHYPFVNSSPPLFATCFPFYLP